MLLGVARQQVDPERNRLLLLRGRQATATSEAFFASEYVRTASGRGFIYKVGAPLVKPGDRDDTASDVVQVNRYQWEECGFGSSVSSSETSPLLVTFQRVEPSELGPEIACVGAEVVVLKKRACELTDELVASAAAWDLDGLPAAVGQRLIVCLPATSIQLLLTIKYVMDSQSRGVQGSGLISKAKTQFVLSPPEVMPPYVKWYTVGSGSGSGSGGAADNKVPSLGAVGGDSRRQHSRIFRPDWNFESLDVGGLNAEFGELFRRAFMSRLAPSALVKVRLIRTNGLY